MDRRLILQPLPCGVIRVDDATGSVIETHEHAGVSKSGSDYFGLSRETAGATTRIDMQWLQPPSNPEANEIYRFYLPLIRVFP
jgi:hypothetical protein